MEYKNVDSSILEPTLAGIEFVSETDNDKRKPFGVSGPDYGGNVIATLVRNTNLESGYYVSIVSGDDEENATLYGFGLDEGTTVTLETLAYWAVGLHMKLEGGNAADYKYRVFNLSTYMHHSAMDNTVYVYLNDIPLMTMRRGRSGTYFTSAVASEFHQRVHKVTARMMAIWSAQCTERMRYNAMPDLPTPMLTAFSKTAAVLDTLLK